MQKINDYFDENGIKIEKYIYKNGNRIIKTDTEKYEVKIKKSNTKEIHDYLRSKGFNNFVNIENDYNDPYEIYKYIDDDTDVKDKSINLVYLLSSLHNKTTTYQETNEDNIKNIYETITNKLEKISRYYYNLQDNIETKLYMSPAEYLLIRNISNIYNSINNSKYYINDWYNIKKNIKKERIALLHNNISLDNFIDKKDKKFKNWEKAKKNYVVYDFYNFYKNNYKDLELNSLFDIYQSKYKYTEDELLLFKSLLFMPWIIELKENNYNNTVIVANLLEYLDKVKSFELEHNQENQKTNNKELNEQNNNI
ncbi:MAG: hypothetical protein E7160_01195 [Firmicutes bacterium]|nr:hypothetical protein [Bacillota bacterium]